MKNNTILILVVALFAAFVVLLLMPQSNYVPYSAGSRYATYEPMDGLSLSSDSPSDVQSADPPATMTDFTQQVLSIGDSMNVEGGNTSTKTENFEPRLDVPQTVKYGPFRDFEIIDKFSQVTKNGIEGVDGCVSSGLSNSGGYMCLTPELIQLLKTRGGNASGGECLKK